MRTGGSILFPLMKIIISPASFVPATKAPDMIRTNNIEIENNNKKIFNLSVFLSVILSVFSFDIRKLRRARAKLVHKKNNIREYITKL